MDTIEQKIAEQDAAMERIWNIVKTWDYKTYRNAQLMFAPVEEDEEY
jgi:hypothetical protein